MIYYKIKGFFNYKSLNRRPIVLFIQLKEFNLGNCVFDNVPQFLMVQHYREIDL